MSNTRIFARGEDDGRQFLVYSMKLDAAEPLAMILPLPVVQPASDTALRFIDLHDYPRFFDDLEAGFPEELLDVSDSYPPSRGVAMKPRLEVVRVGSFEASFVPTITDFERLDSRFRLPVSVWAGLPDYREYGFAVFKLAPGAQSVHPMAFSFPRADPDRLFFPTLHIHDGVAHPLADYDHVFYCQLGTADLSRLPGWERSDRQTIEFVNISRAKGIVAPNQPCFRDEKKGRLRNRDLFF